MSLVNTPEAERTLKRNLNKIFKTSEDAAIGQLHHLLLVVLPDGRLRVSGSDDFVPALKENEELYHKVEKLLEDSYARDRKISSLGMVDYPRLPCSPFSPEWGKVTSATVRSILNNMLASTGHTGPGKNKSCGVGDCPVGWPHNIISWDNYKGASRAVGLDKMHFTKIIISLLRGSGYNPEEHVQYQSSNTTDSSEDAPASQSTPPTSTPAKSPAIDLVHLDGTPSTSTTVEPSPLDLLDLPDVTLSENNNISLLDNNEVSLPLVIPKITTVDKETPTKEREKNPTKKLNFVVNSDVVFPVDNLEDFGIGSEFGTTLNEPVFEPTDGFRIVEDGDCVFYNLNNIDEEFNDIFNMEV